VLLLQAFVEIETPYYPRDMKNKVCSMLVVLAVIGTPTAVRAQSLDEALGVGKSDLAESKPETKQMWNALVTALERGDMENAKKLAEDFGNVIDFTEPYQKNFASAALAILSSDQRLGPDGKPTLAKATLAEIAEVQAQIATKEREISALEDKRTGLQKKLQDSNMAGAVIGGLLGPQLGGIANADKQNVQMELENVEKQMREKKNAIGELQESIPLIEQKGRQSLGEDRDKAFILVKELIEGGYFREAIALSNTYLKRLGQDTDFVKLSQSAVNQQKVQIKAVMIAKAATKDAAALMDQNRLWDAKVEMERSIASIRERINWAKASDAELLNFTQIEMGKISRDLTRKIEVAQKARDIIFQSAQRDAIYAGKKYAEFLVKYPDFPDADADNLKLSDLKTSQVEAKFAKRIAAIEEVISNDPAEAKEMIKRLIADNTDPDEVSVIKSRMSKLEKMILKEEIAAIQKRLDEAQSYLTKWNVTFAESIKKGEEPASSLTASLSGGTENLTRAISIQEGVVKQIDVLLQEKMDGITKSQVVALQETAKAALNYMGSAKEKVETAERERVARNKIITISLIVLAVAGLAVGAFLIMKKKKPQPSS